MTGTDEPAGDGAQSDDAVDLTPWTTDVEPATLDWFFAETLSASEVQ